MLVRNRTPSSTGDASFTLATAGTAESDQIVQGQPDAVADVVKDHTYGDMVLPLRSVAPLAVAV